MIFLAVLLLGLSLLIAWRALTGRTVQTSRVVRLILASCLFFSAFFLIVQQLAVARYIAIVREPWMAVLSSKITTISLIEGEKISLPLLVENQGTETLDSTLKSSPVFLSFHILDENGKIVIFDNLRFAFAEPLLPQQQQLVTVVLDTVLLQVAPGRYIVEFDLVREGEFWFGNNSGRVKPLRLPLVIGGKH